MSSDGYPISGIPDTLLTGSGGAGVFDSPDALAINTARMEHLGSLGLPIAGRTVLDVGSGVGRLAQFFVDQGCKVTCVDGREENIGGLRSRYPGLEAHVANVETDSFARFGMFEIVFCYGLLYHLENPLAGLRNIASVCGDLLFLETMVTDHSEPIARLADEPNTTQNQSLGRFGTRPSPAFVAMALNRLGFPFIYAPKTPPHHADFRFDWTNRLDCLRDGHLLRCIFVASRRELSNSTLMLVLANPKIAGIRQSGFQAVVTQVEPPSATPKRNDLRVLTGAVQEIQPAHADAQIQAGTPPRIVTPEGRWSFAAAIPLAIPADTNGEVWVRVRATVLRGEGGFGLLNRAQTAFHNRSFLAAGPESQTTYLRVEDIADLEGLIVENSTPDGTPAELLLDEVQVLAEPIETNGAAWPHVPGCGRDALLKDSFDLLRKKWGEVPATEMERALSGDLMKMEDADLLAHWSHFHDASSAGEAFSVRGWYQTIYKDVFRDKNVLDFGCGLAIDTLLYAEHGAKVTFVDLVRSNVDVVRRLCELKGLTDVRFCYMEDLRSLADLPRDYDVIYCCGSLINAPLEMIRLEAQELLGHLKVGGRWIELAYPKIRWEREGKMPFDHWGEKTDGGAPWMEWHDLAKLKSYLAPATFDVVMEVEFHGGDFNWFDLIRRT
jgi:2-polyprenyl-3-methyl-5-hydroxy-6-metoxy-1,4-benzoquinol methylase